MIEVNFNDIKRYLCADGCADLLRGVACLRWSLLAGQSYEQAVRPWKRNVPKLFTKRGRPAGHRTRRHLPPRNESSRNVRHA
jgi:hypothetical protein